MEEIIIDGVNVAGCVQLVEEPNYPCGLGGECKGWENCYYKQLKRLEQENAELKERKDKYYQRTLDLEIVVSEYQQALEEIRDMFLNQVAWCGQLTPFEEKIYKIINEVLGNENNSK